MCKVLDLTVWKNQLDATLDFAGPVAAMRVLHDTFPLPIAVLHDEAGTPRHGSANQGPEVVLLCSAIPTGLHHQKPVCYVCKSARVVLCV